jgi:hypothetical protein
MTLPVGRSAESGTVEEKDINGTITAIAKKRFLSFITTPSCIVYKVITVNFPVFQIPKPNIGTVNIIPILKQTMIRGKSSPKKTYSADYFAEGKKNISF